MKFRHATMITVPLLCAAFYWTYLRMPHSNSAARESGDVAIARSPPTLANERRPETNVVDLIALQRQVDSLSGEVAALRHQMSAQAAHSSSRADDNPPPDMRADPAARAEAEDAQLAQIARVDAAFREQPVDQSWSANTTSTIRDLLSNAEGGGLQADNIECRTSSCRVELHDDGTGKLGKLLPMFALQLAGSMPTITADTIEQANGTSSMVLYTSRGSGETSSQ